MVGEIIRAYQAGKEETMIEILEVVNRGALVGSLVVAGCEADPR